MEPAATFSDKWLTGMRGGARSSAETVLPIVLDLVRPRSIVDVGCATGIWLSVAADLGVETILGIDGPYVRESSLDISPERFLARDLREPLSLPSRFDLALCLEVGQHIEEAFAETLVASLVGLAPTVLFSSAVPFQSGTRHVNEQWQDWWADRFCSHGYVPIDCVRPRVWSEPAVRYYYAQNTLLYVEERAAETFAGERSRFPLRVVHPSLYLNMSRRFPVRGQATLRGFAYFVGRPAAHWLRLR